MKRQWSHLKHGQIPMTRWAFLFDYLSKYIPDRVDVLILLSASVLRFDCGMQVQTGLLTAAMNGDVATLQRLGDLAPAAVPFICNKVLWVR